MKINTSHPANKLVLSSLKRGDGRAKPIVLPDDAPGDPYLEYGTLPPRAGGTRKILCPQIVPCHKITKYVGLSDQGEKP